MFKNFTLILMVFCSSINVVFAQSSCQIDFTKNSGIDFFSLTNRALGNFSEGTFTITANEEMVRVFVTPTFNNQDDQLSYGSNYTWMIEGNALPQFDVLYSVGDVAADSTYEFKVYPQTLVDLLPAGQRASEINLQVQCIPHSRLPEKYKRYVGFEMIKG